MRDFDKEAQALPHRDFDLRMHGYMLKTFAPYMDGVSALELGCFEGAMTRRLRDFYPDVTVVDASADCIAKVRAIGRQIECVHASFEEAILEYRYDAIFALHVLEHLDGPMGVLRRCRDWLAPGGRLFIAVPNAFAASRQIAVHMGLVEFPQAVTPAEAAHGHKRTYGLPGLLDDIEQANFKVVDCGGIFFKALSGEQFDKALKEGIVSEAYMDACYTMGRSVPDLCASLYAVCEAA